MRRCFLLSATIGWAASLATAIQAGIGDDGGAMLDQLLSETPGIQPVTENSTTSSLTKRPTDPTLPKIVQIHVPKSQLQVLFNSTSSFSAVPQIDEFHRSESALIIPRPTAVLQPGLQAVGMMDPELTTTPINISATIPSKGPSTTPVASNLSTPINSLEAAAAENHSLQTGGLQGGLGALGQLPRIQSATPTSTTASILMSGFVYKGTSYPPLLIMSSAEQHSSQATLNPQATASSAEEHTSQTNLIDSTHQPSIQPTPTATTTTPTPSTTDTDTVISAFTFRGTAYPAMPLVPESAAAASYQSTQLASSTTIQPQPTTPIPTTTTTPLPNPQTSAGISISGHPLPTTFGNIAGPSTSSSASSPLSPSPSIYISENPAGIPVVATTTTSTSPASSLYISENPAGIPVLATTTTSPSPSSPSPTTTPASRLYALTTDPNGFVSLRATGWGGGYSINGTGTSGRGNQTGVVPFLSEGRRRRVELGLGGWGWIAVLVGVGLRIYI
ncbi:MAG: hypothetical protein Q9195_000714 [Heterodermia aff. obscurata]